MYLRRNSTSPPIVAFSGRRNSSASGPADDSPVVLSDEERLRRRSEDSSFYDPTAITPILHKITLSSLLEQAEREQEEMLAAIEAIKQKRTSSLATGNMEGGIGGDGYDDDDADDEGLEPLSDELVEKYRRHFLKATRHLQQELPNSYVILTGIGYVPSVISMVQFLEPDSYYFERGQGRTYLYLVLSAISFYIITYAILYFILFPWFAASMNGQNLAPLKDAIIPDHDPPTIWATLDYKLIRQVVDAPPGLHHLPSILGFYRLMYIVYDIASGIFSFIMLTAIILSDKNEDYYNGGGLEQMVFTVWIFIINTLMFMVHIYAMIKADIELRRQWHQRNKHRLSKQHGEPGTTEPEIETGQLLPDERQCSTPPPIVTQD
ncbi:hypothetical protein BDA99DRAFT_529988 [Phascolomyces articulosus]|uniref:Uncharacterized protein n=1 Tax=Phascolomyces articulosus TaxID=60185 RepID=A0AAD5P704_9FUNG|nr:hypothetical protein BDA99DRAFT_529988 [Phascolomyces articulosus]